MRASETLGRILIPLFAIACLSPWMPSAVALISGTMIAVAFGNPFADMTRRATGYLLPLSVVGLGFGMNLVSVAKLGGQGIGYTAVGICGTLFLGMILARVLDVERDAGLLITAGTAICGGSAIAAIAPVLRAKPHSISVALGTVFLLNAVGLLIFPPLGFALGLSQTQFGLWSALAIHDTSSVVGATLQYGPEALQIGTTVKLARALWIVPLTILAGIKFGGRAQGGERAKPKRPWFILGFLIAAGLVTWIPELAETGHTLETVAKRTLVLTLFLIGTNLTRATLKSVGFRPFVLGVLLWLCAGSLTLGAVLLNWIHG